MKINILAIAFTATAFLQASPAADWVPLFNGKDLSGWKQVAGKAQYQVRDGMIVGISAANTPNSFLATEKPYGDFILEADFKVDDGLNSGLQIRSHADKGRVSGLQYEHDTSPRSWTGGLYDEARRGWLYNLESNLSAKKAYKHGEWNKLRIEAIGNNIRTWLNGVPCTNLIDDKDKEGFIALQVHNIGKNEKLAGKEISWKDLRICTTGLDEEATPDKGEIFQVNNVDNTLSPREIKDGWKLLWDGKTKEGWRGAKLDKFPAAGWTIDSKNKTLKVLKGNGGESTNGGDIVTTKKYKNFELVADFKITDGANSGIKYFVDTKLNKGEGSSIGCEFQILDDKRHPDAKLGKNGNRTLGSLYDLIPAPTDKPFRPGTFNTAKVVVNGNKVEHWLNGTKIVEYTRGDKAWRDLVAGSKYKVWPAFGEMEEGHILLQDHGDEVSYKNIKIKELP